MNASPQRGTRRRPLEGRDAEPYVRALRFHRLTQFYDRVVAALLKEEPLKKRLTKQAAVRPGHRVLDLGCGTATLTLLAQAEVEQATVVGVDGDLEALAIARRKALEQAATARFCVALGQELPFRVCTFDRVVSSLLFHHLTTTSKLAVLNAVKEVLSADGELHILDWGKAQDYLMRGMFLLVQILDGFQTTADNVRGLLPGLIIRSGFSRAEEMHRERSLLGTLSLYRATTSH